MAVGLKKGLDNSVYDITETTSYFVQAGTGTIGDGVSATGSTASVSFTDTYSATPTVVGTIDASGLDMDVVAGSFANAGAAAGSAVFYGVSGAGFSYLAYGLK